MPNLNKRMKIRKVKYNTHLGRRIASLVAQGYSIHKIANNEEIRKKHRITIISDDTIRNWARDIPEFKAMIEQAYRDRADHFLEKYMDTMEAVESGDMEVKVGEFLTRSQQWLLEKLHPTVIEADRPAGKSTLNINAESGAAIQIVLADPKKKALPAPVTIEAEVVNEGEGKEEGQRQEGQD